MTRKYSSISVEQLLDSPMGAADTTLTLDDAAAVTAILGGISLGAGNVDQFTIAVDPDTSSEEIIFVRGTSGAQLTGLVRAQAGTSATTHVSGATVKHVLTSDDLDFYTSGVDSAATASSTTTFTNKTIALGSNTVSGTTAQFNTALTDGDFATLAGTETLTNKTIDAANNTLTGVATLTGTQTLTNKTIDAASNTLTGVATLTGTQTLTNKTIDYNSNTITNLPTSNSITLLSTTTVSSGSATVSVTGISGSYTNLMVDIELVTAGTGAVYLWLNSSNSGSSAQSVVTFATGSGTPGSDASGDRLILAPTNTEASVTNKWVVNIYNYTSTQAISYSGRLDKTPNDVAVMGGGGGKAASYSAITLETTGTTNTSGTIKIYGVK
jgi:hypothetical protein